MREAVIASRNVLCPAAAFMLAQDQPVILLLSW